MAALLATLRITVSKDVWKTLNIYTEGSGWEGGWMRSN